MCAGCGKLATLGRGPPRLQPRHAPTPDDATEETLQNETLHRAVAQLPSRQRQIIECRYGLEGRAPQTLGELGRTFNVSRERVRQIEQQGLKQLRALAAAS